MACPEPLELTPAQLARLAAVIFGPPVLIRLPRRRGRLRPATGPVRSADLRC